MNMRPLCPECLSVKLGYMLAQKVAVTPRDISISRLYRHRTSRPHSRQEHPPEACNICRQDLAKQATLEHFLPRRSVKAMKNSASPAPA